MSTTRHRFHSFKYEDGTEIKGLIPLKTLQTIANYTFKNIDFTGKRVLDVGCWDGYFSIEACKRGAFCALGIDINPWSKWDWHDNFSEARIACNTLNACQSYRSLFEYESNPNLDLESYDITLFMGVLYHLQDPLRALRILRKITKEKLILESLIDCEDLEYPAMRFYPGSEKGNDPTNWFGPNRLWIESALKVVGFKVYQMIDSRHDRVVYHAS